MAQIAFLHFIPNRDHLIYIPEGADQQALEDELNSGTYTRLGNTVFASAVRPDDTVQSIRKKFADIGFKPLILLMRFPENAAAGFGNHTTPYWKGVGQRLKAIAGL